jgi:hypothetical protein
MRYFTLCTLENGTWCPAFGDYSRENVVIEAQKYVGIRCRIIQTCEEQDAIVRRVAAMNAENHRFRKYGN